jgi:hypothetical protein
MNDRDSFDRRDSSRRAPFVTPKPKREVDDELRFHLEQRIQSYIAGGMSPDAARRAALERFGDVDGVREECEQLLTEDRKAEARRDWFDDLRQDLRFGFARPCGHRSSRSSRSSRSRWASARTQQCSAS